MAIDNINHSGTSDGLGVFKLALAAACACCRQRDIALDRRRFRFTLKSRHRHFYRKGRRVGPISSLALVRGPEVTFPAAGVVQAIIRAGCIRRPAPCGCCFAWRLTPHVLECLPFSPQFWAIRSAGGACISYHCRRWIHSYFISVAGMTGWARQSTVGFSRRPD